VCFRLRFARLYCKLNHANIIFSQYGLQNGNPTAHAGFLSRDPTETVLMVKKVRFSGSKKNL